jgi:PhnB protein
MTVRAIPEGYHTATPHLVVKDAARAIEFYKQAFGATELMRLTAPGGIVAHAEIKIGDSIIMLADEFPNWGNHSPTSLGGTPARIHLYVEDVDAMFAQAVAAGSEVQIPVDDQFYGDRSGRLVDPFGHMWIIGTHKQDMTQEEMQRSFEQFLGQQGGAH